MQNIQRLIKNSIDSDTDFNDKENKRIVSRYNKMNDKEKENVNDIFISLTGYSLETIINDALGKEIE